MYNNFNNSENEDVFDEEYSVEEQQNTQSSLTDGCFYFNNKGKLYCCITIIGQIEGHYLLSPRHKTTKYEHIIPKLISIDNDENVRGLLLILNTVGGDIEAGMAISELIAGLNKPTVSLVLGGGHSIGIPLAVSANKSFITNSATMTLHPVRMTGTIMGVPQQLAYFQNMQERIINFISSHSEITTERLRNLMLSSGNLVSDFGTVLNGLEAVNEGIIGNIGSLNDALNCLSEISQHN